MKDPCVKMGKKIKGSNSCSTWHFRRMSFFRTCTVILLFGLQASSIQYILSSGCICSLLINVSLAMNKQIHSAISHVNYLLDITYLASLIVSFHTEHRFWCGLLHDFPQRWRCRMMLQNKHNELIFLSHTSYKLIHQAMFHTFNQELFFYQ